MTGFLKLGLGLIGILAMQPAFSHHVDLPEGMTPAWATWFWGHHSIPSDITISGTPYWYVYPHTDVNQIADPVWSDVAATHIKPGAKAPEWRLGPNANPDPTSWTGGPRSDAPLRRRVPEDWALGQPPRTVARQLGRR